MNSNRIPPLALVVCLIAVLAGCGGDKNPGAPPAPVLVTVEIVPQTATFTAIGERMSFEATAFDDGGAVMDTVFVWSSSRPDVVTVGPDGAAIAAGGGAAEIYATAGGVTDTAAVTVDLSGDPVIEWIAAGDGAWEDGANWSGGAAPGGGDVAVIAVVDTVGTYTVTVNGDVTVKSLIIGAGEGWRTLATGIHTLTCTDIGLHAGGVLFADGLVRVTGNVELPARTDELGGIDVGVEDDLFLGGRSRDDLSVGVDDHALSRIDPALDVAEVVRLEGQAVRDVVDVEGLATPDDEAAALFGRVPHGREPGLAPVPRGRHVDLLAPRR